MRCRNLAVLAVLAGALTAQAADWRPVAAASGDRIELDRDRIVRTGDGKSLAWTRLTSDHELSDGEGSYSAILALNRYDCADRSFVTLKRVYLRGGTVVREEKVSWPREMAATAGSPDEQVVSEVCKPRSEKEARLIAEQAAKATEARPSVMHADMRTAEGPSQVRTVPVADAASAASAAALAVAAALPSALAAGLPAAGFASPVLASAGLASAGLAVVA